MTCCNYRRGEEWYKVRRILNMKMLKPKVIGEYAQGLNEVSSDLLSRLKQTRDDEGLIPNIQDELFKWSLECESSKPFFFKRSCILSRWLSGEFEPVQILLHNFFQCNMIFFNIREH